jgi:2-O-methyltransferase
VTRRNFLTIARNLLCGEPGVVPKHYFRQYLPAAPVIVEAGAHDGRDTLGLSRTWRDGRVHAFEPVPALFQTLRARVGRRPNVRCYPLALSDRSGTAEMFISRGATDASSSLLRPTGHLSEHSNVLFDQRIAVATTTLDAWVEAEMLDTVDFLWLDMQGGELAALRAAPNTIEMVSVVYMEVSLVDLYDGAPLYPEVRRWMSDRGFSVIREELPATEGNVVFLRTH